MASALSIATIGLDPRHRRLFNFLVKFHLDARELRDSWLLRKPVDAAAVIATPEAGEADVVIVDVDSDAGRMAWYAMQAVVSDGLVVACTRTPQSIHAGHVISKPLGNGAELVRLLNMFSRKIQLQLARPH